MAGEVRRAPECGPARGAAHPEMVERGRAGGGAAKADGGGNAAGRQCIAAAGEYLSPLRIRPVGPGVAADASPWRYDYRAVCRRPRARIPASVRGRAVVEGAGGTLAPVPA